MKVFYLLTGLALFAAFAFCADEISPPTLPAKPTKGYAPWMQSGGMNGLETRVSRVGTKDYISVITHRDIALSPEWKPSSDLPTNLGKIEEIARAELQKLVADPDCWETSSIQLNRVAQSTESKWYYAVSFSPVLKVPSLGSDSMVVLLTLDGKPGNTTVYRGRK